MAAAIVLIIAAASLLIPRAGYYLTLRNKDSGELYARYRMDEGDRFSITFKHSVNQYPLTDTFEISEGRSMPRSVSTMLTAPACRWS